MNYLWAISITTDVFKREILVLLFKRKMRTILPEIIILKIPSFTKLIAIILFETQYFK